MRLCEKDDLGKLLWVMCFSRSLETVDNRDVGL